MIDIENIVRRLRENARAAQPRPAAQVVINACLEVRSSVVYATLALILVVVPVMALPGIARRLFGPLALAYTLAVLASLVVALTVTPALAMAFLPGRIPMRDPPVMRWARAGYERLLRLIAREPQTAVAAAVLFTALGCALLPLLGGSFIPDLKEGHFIIHMAAVPGTSLDQSMRIGDRVTRALLRLPEIRSVAQWAGRAEQAADTTGPHYSEFEVDLKPGLSGEQTEKAQRDIRKALSGFVGVNFAVNTFLTERIEETLSGYTAPVAVNIFGNNLDLLEQKAQQIAKVLATVPGATDVQVQSPPGLPQLVISLRKSDLERWGFDPVAVLDVIRTAYRGDVVGQTYQGNQVSDVMVQVDDATRRNVAAV
ncbi:MAG: efflux RND transporter permease subunit, partial [Pseudolabrys sp.]